MNVLKNLLLSALLVFAPVKAVMVTALALVTCDLILGIMAARKRGEHITSAGFKRTLVKLCIYELTIALGFLCETYMTGDLIPVSKIIAGFIGLTEIKSLIENLNELSGTDLLKQLIDSLAQKTTHKE